MKAKPNAPVAAADMRCRAEARLRERPVNQRSKTADPKSVADPLRLLHELQVHQVELEMQNAELQVARDWTEALLENYTDLYDFAPVGYFTLAATGVIIQANLTGAKLVGIERSRLLGQSFGLYMVMEFRPAFNAFLKQVFVGQTKQSGDFQLLCKSQPLRFVNIEAQRLLNGQECRAAVMDITARKATEETLRRSKTLFSALVEQAPIGVYVVDARFRLQQVNPKALSVFGNVHSLIGRNFFEVLNILWPRRVADQIENVFRHTMITGEAYQSPEFARRRRDTGLEEIYEWQIQRVTLPAGEYGVVCFFNNITKRKRAEEAQRRLDVLTASNKKLKLEIVRRKAVEQALHQSEQLKSLLLEQVRHLSHETLYSQENERKRISRELHDTVVQTLVGINIHLSALTKQSADNPRRFHQNIVRTQRIVEKSVAVVHQFALELRPTMLDDLGLIPALHTFLKDFLSRTGVRARLTAFAAVEKLSIAQRTVLYRVAVEGLNNVASHAQASNVEVSIKKLPGCICLTIKDDGKSFDVKRVLLKNGNGRLGLLGIRERLEMVGGQFTIESSPGHGTTLTARIPFVNGVGRVADGVRRNPTLNFY